MDNIEKIVNNKILGIIPVYLKNMGNSTSIITLENEEIYIYKAINTVIKILAKYFLVDLNACKSYCRKTIGILNVSPLVFNHENIFVPLKVRKPISKNDGSLGYFNINYIKEIKVKDEEVFIILNEEIKIKCIQSYKTVNKHINDGRIIKEIYKGRSKISLIDFHKEYDKPATKKDILILREEILDIKSRLNIKI